MNWKRYLSEERLCKLARNEDEDKRNEFESDYGRIIFSPAVRRMHDKTQAMPFSHDDNIHTRLTHSLEVMAVAYSIGLRLIENKRFLEILTRENISEYELSRKIPVILQNAALVHDVGNPPFGHFGEVSIQDFFREFFKRNKRIQLTKREKEDFTAFDGNAQGFRIVTKLQVLDDPYVLNLTTATLGAFLKYPNYQEINKNYIYMKKRGVFQSEQEYLNQVAEACGMRNNHQIIRHPLAFLVEAADTICYRIMDIEDVFNKKWFTFNELMNEWKKKPKHPDVVDISNSLEEINKERKSETAKIVAFRRLVINKLVRHCIDRFVSNIDAICEGTYHKELIEDEGRLNEYLQYLSKKWIFKKKEIVSMELKGDTVIKGLLHKYIHFLLIKKGKYAERILPLISKSVLKAAFIEKGVDNKGVDNIDINESFDSLPTYYKLRVIVDHVSGMTDTYALSQYQMLYGANI